MNFVFVNSSSSFSTVLTPHGGISPSLVDECAYRWLILQIVLITRIVTKEAFPQLQPTAGKQRQQSVISLSDHYRFFKGLSSLS